MPPPQTYLHPDVREVLENIGGFPSRDPSLGDLPHRGQSAYDADDEDEDEQE